MNLECPGCRARLKLDPARLPPGATTAVCPKCKTRVLLPGAAAASADISVSCASCSARLRVNVARLKPAPSQSKCPKCGAPVTLPAASAATPAAETAPPVSAATRRLDPRELGVMLGTVSAAAPGGMTGQASPPIAVEDVLAQSDVDLGKLIDQKVDGLGRDASGRQRAVSSPALATPIDKVESIPLAPRAVTTGAPARETAGTASQAGSRDLFEPPRRASESGGRSVPDAPRKGSESGARPAPRSDAAPAAHPPSAGSRTMPLLAAGVVGGAVVSALLSVAGGLVPAMIVPRAPEPLIAIVGEKVALVLVMVVLAALASVLSGMARPPAGTDGSESAAPSGISAFRSGVAAGLMGLLAGIAISLTRGGFDLLVTLTWTLGMALCGLASAPIASLLMRRPTS
ncbi:MAG: hypothetical protein HY049_16390 [Acidobacteria bacterium]|nr:hypothetical protein [Acidobacteriota bacterium]